MKGQNGDGARHSRFAHSWLRHPLAVGGEFLTHWAAGGIIIALTGLAPEHWLADFFHSLAVPDSLWRGWVGGADIRTALVLLGVGIIGWDVVRRGRAEKKLAATSMSNAIAPSLDRTNDKTARRTEAPSSVPILDDKPSLAVLPFQNMSDNPSEEYISDGITEDIITELSRFSNLFVIARNSSFQYKGKAADVRQVGQELGVHYVLEGSVRRSSGRVRITAQLIDTETGAHRWAERYDRELDDIFAIQDELARTITPILAAHLNKAEIDRVLVKHPTTWQAYDHYMRGAAAWLSFLSSWKLEELEQARHCLSDALSIDPKYARAYVLLSTTYRTAWLAPLNEEHLQQFSLDKAIQLARKAIELDPNLPEAYAELAFTIIRKRDFDGAKAAAEKAIKLNPNFIDYRLAFVFMAVGNFPQAMEIAKAQMRCDPFHPHLAPFNLGMALYLDGRYEDARHWLRETTSRSPNHQYGHAWLAATYARLGRTGDAQAEAAEVLRLNPKYSINGTQQQILFFKRAEDIEHIVDGLRKAGLPE